MSKSADLAVGMMDTAYFVGRGELLQFFNNLLDLQLTKIEQTASGAIACQLTEYIFPGSIPMSKVNWEAKSDYEFINNYKLLQKAFSKHRIQRHVDVDKLIRAKYQDNLEFCQWLKAFYDQSGAVREDYDPNAVRAKGKGGKKYNDFLQRTAAKYGSKALPVSRTRGARVTPTTAASPRKPVARPAAAKTTTQSSVAAPRPTVGKAPLRASENRNVTGAANNPKPIVDPQLVQKNAELEETVKELETTVLELEKERDFYFGKLRNIELMLQVKQDSGFEGCDLEGVVGEIFKVLYATVEDDVEVGDNGEIIASQVLESAETSEVLNQTHESVEQDVY